MQVVAIDFDGVINSYASGWSEELNDPPIDGIYRCLKDLSAEYKVVVYTTRSQTDYGKNAVWAWLRKWRLDEFVKDVTAVKPTAFVYIDDRAICFDGHPETLIKKVREFKTWQGK